MTKYRFRLVISIYMEYFYKKSTGMEHILSEFKVLFLFRFLSAIVHKYSYLSNKKLSEQPQYLWHVHNKDEKYESLATWSQHFFKPPRTLDTGGGEVG